MCVPLCIHAACGHCWAGFPAQTRHRPEKLSSALAESHRKPQHRQAWPGPCSRAVSCGSKRGRQRLCAPCTLVLSSVICLIVVVGPDDMTHTSCLPQSCLEIRDGNSQISLSGERRFAKVPRVTCCPRTRKSSWGLTWGWGPGPRSVPTLPGSVGQKPKARVGVPKGEEKRLC